MMTECCGFRYGHRCDAIRSCWIEWQFYINLIDSSGRINPRYLFVDHQEVAAKVRKFLMINTFLCDERRLLRLSR